MTETIKINGMSCDGCVNSVKNALGRVPINKADVKIGEATVEYDEKMVNRHQIVEAIQDAGFDVVSPGLS
jgi:copper chaperone